jgi:hypothetical protein
MLYQLLWLYNIKWDVSDYEVWKKRDVELWPTNHRRRQGNHCPQKRFKLVTTRLHHSCTNHLSLSMSICLTNHVALFNTWSFHGEWMIWTLLRQWVISNLRSALSPSSGMPWLLPELWCCWLPENILVHMTFSMQSSIWRPYKLIHLQIVPRRESSSICLIMLSYFHAFDIICRTIHSCCVHSSLFVCSGIWTWQRHFVIPYPICLHQGTSVQTEI